MESICAESGITGVVLGERGAGTGAVGLGHMTAKMKREKRKKRGIAIRVLPEASQVKETRRGGM